MKQCPLPLNNFVIESKVTLRKLLKACVDPENEYMVQVELDYFEQLHGEHSKDSSNKRSKKRTNED